MMMRVMMLGLVLLMAGCSNENIKGYIDGTNEDTFYTSIQAWEDRLWGQDAKNSLKFKAALMRSYYDSLLSSDCPRMKGETRGHYLKVLDGMEYPEFMAFADSVVARCIAFKYIVERRRYMIDSGSMTRAQREEMHWQIRSYGSVDSLVELYGLQAL